eukprot:2083173-Pyramimonas_sp.AAC.1
MQNCVLAPPRIAQWRAVRLGRHRSEAPRVGTLRYTYSNPLAWRGGIPPDDRQIGGAQCSDHTTCEEHSCDCVAGCS